MQIFSLIAGVWRNWKCWPTWKYFRVYRKILATPKIFRNHFPSFVGGYKNQKKKKKNTSQAPSPHPQPRLRTNPTTKFGQTTIESDYQRWVPQLPPFLDYFSISLIEPMLQWWDPPTHATIELLMTPPSHQLICFSLYISHVIVNLVFSFFFFLFSFFFSFLHVYNFLCGFVGYGFFFQDFVS